MIRYVGGPTPERDKYVLDFQHGGTNSVSGDEFRTKANAVGTVEINKPLGPLGLTADSTVTKFVFDDDVTFGRDSVTGPVSMYIDETAQYVISDYDSLTQYELTVIGTGQVSRVKDIITYSPGSTSGQFGFTLNSRTYQITIQMPVVAKAAITTPVKDAQNVNRILDARSSSFKVLGSTDTHDGTDWEIATDINFVNFVSSTVNSATCKTGWNSPSLNPNTTYYARCRYKGVRLGYGAWSDPVSFKTKPNLIPTAEESNSYPSDRVASAKFGTSVAMSKDGFRIAIGSPGNSTVYVFKREFIGWVQEQKLSGTASTDFGMSVSMNADGSRLVVGSPKEANGPKTQVGMCRIYHRVDSTWNLKVAIGESIPTRNNKVGTSVCMNDEGTWIVSGTPDKSSSAGGAVVFQYNSATDNWSESVSVTGTDSSAKLGTSVSIDGTGTYFVLGGPNSSGAGKVRVWKRTGTSWIQISQVLSPLNVSGELFGYAVDISNDASTLVASARNSTSGQGKVYVYQRSGDTFNHVTTLSSQAPSSNAYFGTAVSISSDGSRILVGEPGEDTAVTESGAGHVFLRNQSGSWANAYTRTLLKPTIPAASQGVGVSLSLAGFGDRAVIGASLDSSGGFSQSGSIHIFN